MSSSSQPSSRFQQALILLVTLLVLTYVGSILWHVSTAPDIGLHCSIQAEINRVDVVQVRSADGDRLDETAGMDLLRSTVERVGTETTETWPRVLRELENLHDRTFPVRSRLSPDGEPYAHWSGSRWVRVALQPPGSGADPVLLWCRIGTASLPALFPSVFWFCLESVILAVSGFVFWKRPHDPAARLFFVLTTVVIAAFMGGFHWSRIVTQPALLLVYMSCAVMLPAVSLHFYQLFPRPKPWLQARPGISLALTYGVSGLFLMILVGGYWVVRSRSRAGADPAEVRAVLDFLGTVIFAYFSIAALLYLASVICLAHSYRGARDRIELNQVRWIFYGSVLATIPLGYSLCLAIWRRPAFGGGAALWPMFCASLCFSAAFTISITRYRLLQLDQLISSGVVYFVVSALAAAVYYVLVFAGTLVMGTQGVARPSLEQAFWVSGSALVLTVGLDLARTRLRRALDRRYRKDKSQLDRTLQQLGDTIEQLADPPKLARRLLRAAADLVGTEDGTVFLRQGEPPHFQAAGSLGVPPGRTELGQDDPLALALLEHEILPAPDGSAEPEVLARLRELKGRAAVALAHEGTLRAFLVLGSKADGGGVTAEDRDLLAAIIPFTALALASAEGHKTIEVLNRELQMKLEKISEQQRRIFALQQQLTTQAKFAAAARDANPAVSATAIEDVSVDSIVGSSAALRQVLGLVRKVAASPSAVLIRGESGTGKELLARAVHDHSPRAARPYVRVHCAALAPTLLESELFGHVKGAFTGAVRDKVGRFEMADGGTVFLDEIGDISLDVQTKLLRVLQEKTFERVGSSDSVQVDVRLVAATHQNLEQLIRQGRFREDLFYRLNVITLAMPPLRERPDDVAELVLHFLRLYGQKCGKPVHQIDDDALLALRAYRWPGNVRELQNAIERAVVVCEGPVLTLDDFPDEVRRAAAGTTGSLTVPTAMDRADDGRWGVRAEREVRDLRERDTLLRTLAATTGNKAEAARLLGMARSTLVSRLKKHGLLKGR